MDKGLEEKFVDKMKMTDDAEQEAQKVADDETAQSIITGQQEVYLEGFGNVVFKMPPMGIALEGDNIYARFKAENLRKGLYNTEAQLKAIYKQPTTIEVDGKPVEVGSGAWTEKEENRLEELPSIIKNYDIEFEAYRSDYQEKQAELEALKGSKTKAKKERAKSLEREIKRLEEEAKKLFLENSKLKLEQLELQNTRIALFSSSLEERANMEKIKFFIPHCVFKKDGDSLVPLWKDVDEFLNSGFETVRVLGIFNLFLRGADVSFFGDTPDEEM